MGVFLIIVIVIVIFVVYSNNKEKERQERQRRIDADNIKTKYKEGYNSWLNQKQQNGYRSYYPSADEVLSNESEIKKLHNEIIERYKAAARTDEQFEKEQKSFNEKCIALSKEHLPNEGRYYYDVEWFKNKSNGGRSKEKFIVWQFFVDGLCLNQELDYTYGTYYKNEFENLPKIKAKTMYWTQPVYDRINTFISAVAESSNRPLIIAFVDTKDGWSNDALEYHLKNIKRDIPNTIVSPLSKLKINIAGIGNQLEHLIVVDAYTENHQLISICENLEKTFSPSHAAISYISLSKCYDSEEMESILKDIQIKHETEQKEINLLKNLPTKVKDWDALHNGMHYYYLLRYYPTTCDFEATDDEWDDRWIVWNFKNNPAKVSPEKHDEAMKWVIQKTEKMLFETFDRDALKYLTLVCIPASSKSSTERRFKDFSDTLCKDTGMDNAYTHIAVSQEVIPKSQGGTGLPTLEFDTYFFKNKNIIIFDDVITSGRSMFRMKQKLEQLGATVIAGISIGKTFHHRPENQSNSSVTQVGKRNYDDTDLPL